MQTYNAHANQICMIFIKKMYILTLLTAANFSASLFINMSTTGAIPSCSVVHTRMIAKEKITQKYLVRIVLQAQTNKRPLLYK